MQVRFEKMFAVEIFHQFYESGISEDFNIIPLNRCAALLKDYGLLFHGTAGGFALSYATVRDQEGLLHPLKPIEENVRFSFGLQPKNPHLINYSDLPLIRQTDQIYYLNNLNDNQQNNLLLLSSSDTSEFISQQDVLPLKPLVFPYGFETGNASVFMEIHDEWSNPVIQKTVAVVEDRFYDLVDLRRKGPGKFTLSIDGVPKEQFYASDELAGKNIFGLIDIFCDDSVPSAYQFTDPSRDHDVLPRTYVVKINNRKTHWKYYLVLKYRLKDQSPADWPDDWPDDWAIEYPPDASVNIAPQIGELKTMGDGTLAVPFISDATLPLQQKPIKGVKLKRVNGHGKNSGIREIENLPNPAVTSVVPDDSENRIYSEIYVYV